MPRLVTITPANGVEKPWTAIAADTLVKKSDGQPRVRLTHVVHDNGRVTSLTDWFVNASRVTDRTL